MANPCLIIPSFRQSEYYDRILDAVSRQTMAPSHVILVLDRPTSNELLLGKRSAANFGYSVMSPTSTPQFIGSPLQHPEFDWFLTGDRRNQAIARAFELNCDSVIFIDGDCIPDPGLIASHSKWLNQQQAIVTVGRRREERNAGFDQREVSDRRSNRALFSADGSDTEIRSEKLMTSSAVTWTCNIGFNRAAIDSIMTCNEEFYGRREFCNSDFLGSWGGEDSFLGFQAFILRHRIICLGDPTSGVVHVDHPRDPRKYDPDAFEGFLTDRIDLFRGLVEANPRASCLRAQEPR